LIEHWAITGLAGLAAALAAPLFADLALCILGNLLPARAPRATVKQAIRLAAVVPAHDEEPMIARTVASLRASDDSLPVYVVAHNCTDGTAGAAAKAGAQVVELNDPQQRGKGAALRGGFQAALQGGANALLVVDADTVVSANLVEATRAALEAGAAATQCRYEMEPPNTATAGQLARLRALAVRGMNVLRPRGRAGLGFSAGLFGNGFALMAETLERAPFTVDSIAEDLEYHGRLVCAGLRVEWLGAAFVHAHLSPAGLVQARQEARWEGGRLGVARRSTGALLAAILRGNWRALESLLDVWSLPLSRGILLLLLTVLLPLHWLHVYALGCAAVTLAYVLGSALLGAEPLRDVAALAVAPAYLAWKAALTPMVLLNSRRRTEWARTERETPKP